MVDLPRPLPPKSPAERVRDLVGGMELKRAAGWAAAFVGVIVAAAVAVAALRSADGVTPPELSLPRAGSTGEPRPGADDTKSTTTLGDVHVHVAGAVNRPGLYRLPTGTRVAGAVEAAGGPTGDADVDQINLAAPVTDGERIYVPRKGESAAAAAAGPSTGSAAASGPVNLNTATLEQLDTLPGIGPTTAQAIIDHRTTNGRFRSVDGLLEVRGIGPAKLEQLRPLVRV